MRKNELSYIFSMLLLLFATIQGYAQTTYNVSSYAEFHKRDEAENPIKE